MPLAAAGVGFSVTLILLVCLWALMCYTALLLLEVYQHVPADTGLGSLAARYLGRYGQWITGFSMMFLMYALTAAYIAHHGEEAARSWVEGLKANLARKATGGDRDIARDILGGICDVGLGNTYYVGHMKAAKEGSDARKWGDSIKVIKPTFNDPKSGTHINISGASVAKHAPNRANAVKLLEFLVSEPAQNMYAQANYEHPVRKGVALDPVVAQNIGEIKIDLLPLAEIAKHRKAASLLVDKVGFDK